MIDIKIDTALNRQINIELASAYNYLAIEAHFALENLGGFAHWMHVQYVEEQAHAMRLFKYLIDRGGSLQLAAVAQPPSKFGTPREVFQKALELERENTKAINELYGLALAQKDYATMNHLNWFLDEQVEEEKIMEEVIGLLDLAGEDRSALLVLNRQMGERAAQAT